jgi:hypothetical protein
MTINDDRSAVTPPAASPPSYLRRHPILAAFGVLSGLSLFSALWPASAVVIAVAVAGHATGLDRVALHMVERLAVRISSSAHHRANPDPAPSAPAPAAPEPSPASPSAPRHGAHAPVIPAARSRRQPHAHPPAAHRSGRARHPVTAERRVDAGMDGPGL